jgi:hypothetical protein
VVEQYRRDSDLRKPKPGMLLRASLERKIDLVASWSIGNSLGDAQAGRAAGTRTILIRQQGQGGQNSEELQRNPGVDFVVDSLEAAVEVVLKHAPGSGHPAAGKKTGAAGHHDEVVGTLHEILAFLKMVDRRAQREDFSPSRLAGMVVQITAAAVFLWSVFAWVFAPEDLLGNHLMRALLAVFLQLLAMTFFIMSSRAK